MTHQAIAAALGGLQAGALTVLRTRKPCPVATYRTICSSVAAADLTDAHAEPIRRRFNAYYGVRRNAAWRGSFYARFEAAKTSALPAAALFEDVVRGVLADTGRVEASFASKLVATLRPDSPIIDSVVRGWLTHLIDAPAFTGNAATVVSYFRWLETVMAEAAATPQAVQWSAAFESAFPTPEGGPAISAVKRLDFLIWGGAPR